MSTGANTSDDIYVVDGPEFSVSVEDCLKLGYVKCPRCWLWTVAGRFNYDHLCDRCCEVLVKDHPKHESVPHILAAYNEQAKKWGAK